MKSKEQKRMEAEARKNEYDALSIEEKIARAKARPGKSAKEISKLLKELPNECK